MKGRPKKNFTDQPKQCSCPTCKRKGRLLQPSEFKLTANGSLTAWCNQCYLDNSARQYAKTHPDVKKRYGRVKCNISGRRRPINPNMDTLTGTEFNRAEEAMRTPGSKTYDPSYVAFCIQENMTARNYPYQEIEI